MRARALNTVHMKSDIAGRGPTATELATKTKHEGKNSRGTNPITGKARELLCEIPAPEIPLVEGHREGLSR